MLRRVFVFKEIPFFHEAVCRYLLKLHRESELDRFSLEGMSSVAVRREKPCRGLADHDPVSTAAIPPRPHVREPAETHTHTHHINTATL